MERMFWKEIKAGNWVEIERVLASNYAGVTPAGIIDRTAALDQYRQMEAERLFDRRPEDGTEHYDVRGDLHDHPEWDCRHPASPLDPQHMMTVWQQQKSGWVVIAHSVTQP